MPELRDCLFCGTKNLLKSKGPEGEISGDHVLKKSIVKELGLTEAMPRRRKHSILTNQHTSETHAVIPTGYKRHNICKKCNTDLFNKIDGPAEGTILALAQAQMPFSEVKGKIAEDLAWWALKVAVVESLDFEVSPVPRLMADTIVQRFRDKKPVDWPSGAVAFLVRQPAYKTANATINGSPCNYGSGLPVGARFVSSVYYNQIQIGIAWCSFKLCDPVFVEGVHAPFFPDPASFRSTNTPLLASRLKDELANPYDTAANTVGFQLIPELAGMRVINALTGVPVEDPILSVIPPIQWRESIEWLKSLGRSEDLRLVQRTFTPVGHEVEPTDRPAYEMQLRSVGSMFLGSS